MNWARQRRTCPNSHTSKILAARFACKAPPSNNNYSAGGLPTLNRMEKRSTELLAILEDALHRLEGVPPSYPEPQNHNAARRLKYPDKCLPHRWEDLPPAISSHLCELVLP
jgi:hypothetical protein